MRHIISLLMENEAGALSRVAGLFSARGYNIESLTVAPTEDETMSRMTIVTRGSDAIIEQIKNDSYDLIVFTSPSTFNNFCSFYDYSLIGKLKMASIGSVTTKAIQKAGFEPLFTARKSNAEGIRDAINEFYQL